jgi:hypothetical protein
MMLKMTFFLAGATRGSCHDATPGCQGGIQRQAPFLCRGSGTPNFSGLQVVSDCQRQGLAWHLWKKHHDNVAEDAVVECRRRSRYYQVSPSAFTTIATFV